MEEKEVSVLKLDVDTLNDENSRLKQNINEMLSYKKEQEEMTSTLQRSEDTLKRVTEENRILTKDFNRERVLRKRYYNQVEDIKGKIRVYCRLRPINEVERRRVEGMWWRGWKRSSHSTSPPKEVLRVSCSIGCSTLQQSGGHQRHQ